MQSLLAVWLLGITFGWILSRDRLIRLERRLADLEPNLEPWNQPLPVAPKKDQPPLRTASPTVAPVVHVTRPSPAVTSTPSAASPPRSVAPPGSVPPVRPTPMKEK